MATKQAFSRRAFLDGVRDYLPTDARIHQTDAQGGPDAAVAHESLREQTFYLFDAETLNAFWHAIVELALEEAEGSVLATFPQDGEVEHARETLAQLARTVDHVELLGPGRAPRGLARVRCLHDDQEAGRDLRLLLYEGRRARAALIGRAMTPASADGERRYTGFFSHHPKLLRHLRARVSDTPHGRAGALREFLRLQAIDQAAKAFRREFSREEQALHEAFRRLQLDGPRYCPAQFASDLEKGLGRLHQWKNRLPEWVERAQVI